MEIAFIKMQALNNDFIIIDKKFFINLPASQIKQNIIFLANRTSGIGADQIILYEHSLRPSNFPEINIEIFNQDGSTTNACGNAFRCLGLHFMIRYNSQGLYINIFNNNIKNQTVFCFKNTAKITDNLSSAYLFNHHISVNMGIPRFAGKDIPCKFPNNIAKPFDPQNISLTTLLKHLPFYLDPSLRQNNVNDAKSREDITKEILNFANYFDNPYALNIGNPHLVFFKKANFKDSSLDEEVISNERLKILGPQLENHSFFPEKVNIEFAQVIANNTIKMKVWERGAGHTLACGTGACATFIAAFYKKLILAKCQIIMEGGSLEVELAPNNSIIMTGEANFVFSGNISL
ncbi:Diaminopimelate epimerase [Candidatus Hepatincolaceae symbiont of Richtersius coronifer]